MTPLIIFISFAFSLPSFQAAEELESAGEEAERLKRQLAWGYVYDLDAAVQEAEREAERGMGRVKRMEEEMAKAEVRLCL